MDSGSVLVMEVYKAKLDADRNPVVGSDGFFEQGEMAAIAVMESRAGWGEEYPEQIRNGTWEYALFEAKEHTLVERDYQPLLRMPQAAGRGRLRVLFRCADQGRRQLIGAECAGRPATNQRASAEVASDLQRLVSGAFA